MVRSGRDRLLLLQPLAQHGGPARRGIGLSVPFAALASQPDPPLDAIALALAAEFREVDADAARSELDRLATELAPATRGGSPAEDVEALRALLGGRHGFAGNRERYDDPDNSMLDLVLERRTGLPILLSIVYVEVARRVEIPLAGVGLPGHYVAGHFGRSPALLLDPFNGGAPITLAEPIDIEPWGAHGTALRMLNNLVGSYSRRMDLARAIRAAELRLDLPLGEAEQVAFGTELRSLRARLN